MNIIKWRYLFFALSLVIIIPGMIALAVGFPTGNRFYRWLDVTITFATGRSPPPAEMIALYTAMAW